MYIIDGHNLIPKLPGMSLRELDDEVALIELLQTFSRVRRKQVLVYFDGAPPGQAGERTYGIVRANFVPAGMTADEAIRRRLVELGRRTRSLTVVSSDRQVQANARALGARVLSSDDFARDLLEAGEIAQEKTRPNPVQEGIKPGDLDKWLDLFGIDPRKAAQPIEPPVPTRRKPGGAADSGRKKNRPRHGFPPKKGV